MYKNLRFHFIILFILFTLTVKAQSWDLGGFIGGAAYMGDLNQVNPAKVNNLAFGAQIKRSFNPYWSLKLNYVHGKIAADDADFNDPIARRRGLKFYSPLDEVTLQTEFNFFKYVPSISKMIYTPYLFTGLGLVGFNPKANYYGTTYELRMYGTEGQNPADTYRNYAVTLPFGFGIKYNFSGKWSLNAEAGYRKAFTDYLDDVSKTYPYETDLEGYGDLAFQDKRRFLSNPTGIGGGEGVQRGDNRPRDSYMFVGLSITYSIFSNKCPVVGN